MIRDINQNSENLSDKVNVNENGTVVEENENQQNTLNSTNEVVEDLIKSPEDSLNPFLDNSPKSLCFSTSNNLINVLQKDAFLSFWTLTKLAVKPLSKSPSDAENDK